MKKKEEAWGKIYNEYFKAAGIKVPDWKTVLKVQELVSKYLICDRLLCIVEKNDANFRKANQALTRYGYGIDPDRPHKEQIEQKRRALDSLATKIEIKSKDIEKVKGNAKLNIWEEKIRLKKYFGFDINERTTTCIEWIELNKQYAKAGEK